MEGNKTRTLFFSEVPDSIWEKIEPGITERYSKGVRTYYTKFGEAYLRKNRPDNDDFYGFSACYKRLAPVVIDFTSDSYKCEVRKDESGFVTITEDGQLLDVFFVDLHYDFLRDLFKMIDFLASKPKYEAFYDYAYKLTCATIGANVLMNYSNLFAPAPVGNNLEGAKKLEEKLNQLYASELQ
jgi:hypothetical protein